MMLDQWLFQALFSLSGRSPILDNGIIFLAVYLPYFIGFATLLYLAVTLPWRRLIQASIATLLSVVLSRFILGESIRYLLPRIRPYTALNLHSLFPELSHSFPSGHALTLFAIGGSAYFYNKRLGIVFCGLSVLVVLARVAAGVHYPSDVTIGALIGLGSAYLIHRSAMPYIKIHDQKVSG
ncbi:MAG: phosphatase PAP2 family protein [Candidatus Kaiserbacteria bacterium]|nr:phosphatase PAP2 family protein [Candidatus Kaiserbacteria bacterium]